jgi:ABC-type nitrate/sulfonate/bicarbonate transport system substrate-binding protein
MDHIKFSMVAPAFPYYPVWVAEDRGYFDTDGIRSEIEITGATDKVTTSLAEGNAQIGMVTPEGVVGNASRGGRLRLIAGNANRAPLSLIGLKSIKEIKGLKGKKVGTSSLKEGTAILVQRMLEAHGLEYPGDYEFAIVGAHPQRWEHLQQGTIDAGLQLIPYNYIAEEAGFTNLGAASDYVPDYAFTAIALNLDWGKHNRDVVVRCLKAMREAVQWTAGNIDEAAAILGRRAHSNDKHSRRALNEMFDGKVSPLDLKINRKAIEAVFENMHRFDLVGNDAKLSYDLCVDEGFLAAAA